MLLLIDFVLVELSTKKMARWNSPVGWEGSIGSVLLAILFAVFVRTEDEVPVSQTAAMVSRLEISV